MPRKRNGIIHKTITDRIFTTFYFNGLIVNRIDINYVIHKYFINTGNGRIEQHCMMHHYTGKSLLEVEDTLLSQKFQETRINS